VITTTPPAVSRWRIRRSAPARRVSDDRSAAVRWREAALGFGMLAPSLLLFAVFVFYPLARTIWLGLHESDPFFGNRTWVGVSQYWDTLTSEDFLHSLWVTFQFVVLTVPAGLILGLALAVAADRTLRGIGFFRTTFSSTVATSVAVASVMWLVLLNPSIGVLTELLPFDVLKNPGLLNSPTWALPAVAFSTTWQNLGFTFIVITAGLQGIPEELFEAAEIDGASGWGRFWNVTLPMLSPTLLFAGTVLMINAFQTYAQIDFLTGGGPGNATEVVVYHIYGGNSPINGNEGVQSASAAILFAITLVVSLVQFRSLERRVHYGG
jgi:sn-glycerol 3-phosphate transport system permease protein